MKKIILLAIAVMLTLSFFACTQQEEPKTSKPPHNADIAPFIGTWKVSGTEHTLTFNDDGTISVNGPQVPEDNVHHVTRMFYYTPIAETLLIHMYDNADLNQSQLYELKFNETKSILTLIPKSEGAETTVLSRIG